MAEVSRRFMIDGKQYVDVAGGLPAQQGAGGRGQRGAPTGPARPSNLVVLTLDGTGKLTNVFVDNDEIFRQYAP